MAAANPRVPVYVVAASSRLVIALSPSPASFLTAQLDYSPVCRRHD
jgi:hypothetical protein